MAIIIDRKVKEGFAYEAAKIAVTTGQNVEVVYENLMTNYKKVFNYIEHKEKWEQEFDSQINILFEKINSETLSENCSDLNKNYNVNFQCKNLMSDKMSDKMYLKCKKPEIDLSWIKNPEILEITKDDMEVHDANRL